MKEHEVAVLERGDRYANDWDYFLRDIASSSLLFFSLSLFPFLCSAFISVSFPS